MSKFQISVGGTYNIGNYESVRVEVTLEGDDRFETEEEVYIKTSEMCMKLAEQECERRRN